MINDIPRISSGEIPSERLYGAMELMNKGWNIDIHHTEIGGLTGKLLSLLKKYGPYLISPSAISHIWKSDIVILKDNFSLMATLVCLLFRKKIIYMDAMFIIPKRFWKRWLTHINLRLATSVISYSDYQARTWEKAFNLKSNRIKTMHYCIDTDFYPDLSSRKKGDYVISIGRDMGRDYSCLSRASRINGIHIKLITLPYLLSDEVISNHNIEILQRIPYTELFNLYQNSLLSVVPLSYGLDYPTGIRGVLESLALGIPTIATRTPVLEEYFQDKKDLLFVSANDDKALSLAIDELARNDKIARTISTNGKKRVQSSYNMTTYTRELESIIRGVLAE